MIYDVFYFVYVLGIQTFRRQMGHFLTDMSNRVEHQKLNQVVALLSPDWVFGVQLDYSCRLKSVLYNRKNRVVEGFSFDHLRTIRKYTSSFIICTPLQTS